ncbi:MAG: response regulator [Candidatus Hodarchaeales archaeon]|jgi:signal transduction histidine kinase/DNA-binding response OmpR family regulator
MPKILLVDDNEDHLAITKKLLKKERPNFHLSAVTTAQKALHKLREASFDAIVSDYQMQAMNGLELLKALRSDGNDIPFIIFTGKGREEVAMRALNLGADYYLRKVLHSNSVYEELAHILARIIEDTAKRKQTESTLERRNFELEVMNQVISASNMAIRLNELLSRTLAATLDLLDFDGGGIYLVDFERRMAEVKHHQGLPKEFIEDVQAINIDEEPYRTIFVKGKPIITENYPSIAPPHRYEWGLLSLASIPLIAKDRVIGALNVASKKRRYLSNEETQILQSIGQEVGSAINRGLLEEELLFTHGQLQESEQRFRQTFRAIPNPAYLYRRLPDGRIILVDANKSALEISQGQVAFCVNQTLEDLASLSDNFGPNLQQHGVDLWEVAINVRGVFESGEPLRVEKNYYLLSGEDKYFFLDYVQTSADTVLIISTDITDRQRRTEELSEFAQAMVHDLRNPLLSIEGYADLLQDKYEENTAKAIGRLAQKMQDLLGRSMALAEAGKIIEASTLIDLTPIIREAADVTIPEHIAIEFDELPAVRGDRMKLVQVFQNLFENAVLHGEPQKIEVRRRDGERAIHLLVINDGKPIPSEYRANIFQRSFSTKKNGGGLGLAIVRKLLVAHGWKIHLDASEETTFRISIPKE